MGERADPEGEVDVVHQWGQHHYHKGEGVNPRVSQLEEQILKSNVAKMENIEIIPGWYTLLPDLMLTALCMMAGIASFTNS